MVTLSHPKKAKNHKYKNLDRHCKERNNSHRHLLGTQIPCIQGFGAFQLTYGIEIWGELLGKPLLEGFHE